MPEMLFRARWPDDSAETYYSPSLVVREYLEPGAAYALDDFVARARIALRTASDRVHAKFGYACPRAAHTLARIEEKARAFVGDADALVRVEPPGPSA